MFLFTNTYNLLDALFVRIAADILASQDDQSDFASKMVDKEMTLG